MITALKTFILKTAVAPLIARPARDRQALALASEGPLVVAGLFSTGSGIGQAARTCADALEKHGAAPLRVDLSRAFNQVDIRCEGPLVDMPGAPRGTLLLHFNAPETLRALARLKFFGFRKWRVVGCWVWEFEEIPPDWREASRYLSEIWTPSGFSAGAIRSHTDLPLRVTPHYIAPPANIAAAAQVDASPRKEIRVLTAADGRSSLSRKNIADAIRAFRIGLGEREDCRLIVKTRNLSVHQRAAEEVREAIDGHPRVEIVDASLSEQDKWNLIASCDIFLSLHRSEGFGLVMAEAMALGKAVIATGWSGNTDFMSEETARLVPYDLTPVVDAAAVYRQDTAQRWAAPDINAAAKALRDLAEAPDERRQLGERARAHILSSLNGSAYLRALNA